MKNYQNPEMSLVVVDIEDVITTSTSTSTGDNEYDADKIVNGGN